MTPARIPEVSIPMPDYALAERLLAAVDAKTKPVGSLGELEALAVHLGLMQDTMTPRVASPTVCVVAGDHGAANEGLSAYPQAVTREMVRNFLAGGAAINAFAKVTGVQLKVVDAGIVEPLGADGADVDGLVQRRLGRGTCNYLREPAMSETQLADGIAAGRALAHELCDGGSTVIGLGEMGIGNTSSAALIMSLLLDLPLPECVGPGTGLDPAGVQRKAALLGKARARITASWDGANAAEALRQAGGFEMVTLAGVALGAAERRATVVVDGFITTAAVLAAVHMAPALRPYCVFAHASAEPGHARLLAALDARPLLSLGLRLGEGTGAALAVPLLRAACGILSDMATFEQADVSGALPDAPAAPAVDGAAA